MFLFNVDRNIFKSIEKMELMDKSTYVQNETELKQKINKLDNLKKGYTHGDVQFFLAMHHIFLLLHHLSEETILWTNHS